ncbi:MAG: NAD dependent epimerase/dehydratase family protein [Tenericutes bacterium ADurb.BinA155]|nr:MAG: NAD dependent epimerase/dehydratase family protein [Tenericutes bacterium ADurb.BinA155]
MEPLTYIITGADGHLGTTLIHLLEGGDSSVRALAFVTPAYVSKSPNVAYFKGDIRDPKSLEPLFAGLEGKPFCLIHCAALIDIKAKRITSRLQATNVEGTKTVFAAFKAHHGTRFIYVSTVDVFAHSATPCTEVSPLVDPLSKAGGYPCSKAAATLFIKEQQKAGADAIIVYPGAAIGPYDSGHNAMVQLVRDYHNGKIPGVVPGGYALVDMRDIASAIITLSKGPHLGDSFILSGNRVSIKDILLIAKAWNGGKGKPILTFSYGLAYLGLPFIALHAKIHHSRPLYTSFALGVVKHANTFSFEAAKQAFGFAPRLPEKAIGDTLSYLKEQSLLK